MQFSSILITGGCGFVGSTLAIRFKQDFPSAKVMVLDNLKRRGSELNVSRLKEHNIEFIHGDIRNQEDFNAAGCADLIIEAAAEPSVLSGVTSMPDYVVNTNLFGTINCLNYAVKHKAAFIFLSTSRVYSIEDLNRIEYKSGETRFVVNAKQTLPGISEKGISELFPVMNARSFYGASKLASELFIQEYSAFYGVKSVINRCGVIAGPWQMGKIDQGVVVLWLAKHYWKRKLSYIGYGGTGKQVRDILHVDDLYRLVKIQVENINKFNGGLFNAGGGNSVSVSLCELTKLCEEITGNKIVINGLPENRIADIPYYISDNSKIVKASEWEPIHTPRQIIADIFQWMKTNEHLIKSILD